MTEMQAALHRLGAAGTADEVVLEYKNRRIGGPVMTTIACHMQLLRPGERTRARRQVRCTNFHVVEGEGRRPFGRRRQAALQ
jgi:gentisate 1,2-dioxygenase